MTALASSVVISLDKGDILGLILVSPAVFTGVMLLLAWATDLMANGASGDGWKVIPVALALCALMGWGAWEFADWLTS